MSGEVWRLQPHGANILIGCVSTKSRVDLPGIDQSVKDRLP
jgi:hypothetical protein